jgi:CRISPR system Cascade subunit CasC
MFGGARRARISSQCIKRAIRTSGTFKDGLKEYLANRSLRFPDQVKDTLMKMEVSEETAREAAAELQRIAMKEKGEEGSDKSKSKKDTSEVSAFKTPQMVFYGAGEVEECAGLVKEFLDSGVKPKDLLKSILDKKGKHIPFPVPKSADIALFGRMVTSDAFTRVDAACQVAHAISTHRVDMEFDFYTAVDDLQPKEEAGAGMMGTTGYNSACFYRYAVLDTEQLKQNLGDDGELVRRTIEAFLRATVGSIPSGKQNTFAAYNPPSLIFAVVRENGAWNLANAFEKPVHAKGEMGLVDASILLLDGHYGVLKKVYGSKGILRECNVTLSSDLKPSSNPEPNGDSKLNNLGRSVADLEELIREVMGPIRFAA